MLLMMSAQADIAPPRSPAQRARDAAARAVERCGPLYEIEEVAFTFVVERGGEEVARRRHVWQPTAGTLTVTMGEQTTTMQTTASMPTDASSPEWATLAPGTDAQQAQDAWGAFVNDSYWLLAPCKLNDEGNRKELGDGGLIVSYEGVGLTPGDVYTFAIRGGEVVIWSFTLVSGRAGKFIWSPYTEVGPLNLSLRREAAEGDMVVRFEDVSAR